MSIERSATSSGESVVLVDAEISGNGATRALPSWNVFAVNVQGSTFSTLRNYAAAIYATTILAIHLTMLYRPPHNPCLVSSETMTSHSRLVD